MTGPASDIGNLVLTAELALEAGNYPLAVTRAKAILGRDPFDDQGWRILVRATSGANDLEGAAKLAEEWVNLAPNSSVALYHLGFNAMLARKKALAARALEQFRTRFPDDAETLEFLTALHETQFGSDSHALELVQQLSSKHPELAGLLALQAGNLHAVNKFDQAYAAAKQAISIDPECVGGWRWLAITAYRTLRYEEARKAASLGQALDPAMRVFPVMKVLSIISWFPLILVPQLFYRLLYAISGVIPGPDALRSLLTLGLSLFLGVKLLPPGLRLLSDGLEQAGLPNADLPLLAVFLACALVPEICILYIDQKPLMKKKPPKIRNY